MDGKKYWDFCNWLKEAQQKNKESAKKLSKKAKKEKCEKCHGYTTDIPVDHKKFEVGSIQI